MEVLVVIGLIFLALWGIGALADSGSSSTPSGSAGEGAVMGPLEMRTVHKQLGTEGDGPEVIEVQARGLMPVRRVTHLAFVTSVFDQTSNQPQPVISVLDDFQEKDSVVYQCWQQAGAAGPNQGFADWVTVGVVVLQALVPPRRGDRNLTIALRVVDHANPPSIDHGFGDGDHPGMLHTLIEQVDFHYEEMGWEEQATGRDESRELAIYAAVAVALADGNLEDSEGNSIREWIEKTLTSYADDRSEDMKRRMNEALRDAYRQARAGDLSLSQVTERMNQVAPRPQKTELLQLCVDVMAADGVMEESELSVIRSLAEAMEIDYDDLEKMKGAAITQMQDIAVSSASGGEALIGIKPEWSREQKLKYLRDAFKRWNNRLQALPPGNDRDNAQRMVQLIGELRSKYMDA